jgi:hypothetical protein
MPYDICLPEAGLSWEKLGPLFERYSITLLGRLDDHWASCYERVVAASPSLSRFHLDSANAAVSFTCRASDGPVEVMSVLKILEGLLARVNREASFAAAHLESEPRPASPRPTSTPPPNARSRAPRHELELATGTFGGKRDKS